MLETRTGDNSAQRVRNAPTKTKRGVLARICRYDAVMSGNNTAQVCLGFITKDDRGVVRGLGEIKILHGEIPTPQTQLRAHAWNIQAKCAELTPRSCVRVVRGEGGHTTHTNTHKHTSLPVRLSVCLSGLVFLCLWCLSLSLSLSFSCLT